MFYHMIKGDTYSWIAELHAEYDNSPTVIVAPNTVSTSGLDSVRYIYLGGGSRGSKPFPKESSFYRMARITDPHVDNLASITDPEVSAKRRKLVSVLYSKLYLHSEQMCSLLEGVFARNRARLLQQSTMNHDDEDTDPKPKLFTCDYLRHARRLSLDVIASQIFGHTFVQRYFDPTDLHEVLPTIIDDALKDIVLRGYMPVLYWPVWLLSKVSSGRRLVSWMGASARLGAFVEQKCRIIYQREAQCAEEKDEKSAKTVVSSSTLKQELDTERCVVRELHRAQVDHATIVAEVVLHFAAGGDTTTSSACFVANEVLKSPRIQGKLEAELLKVFPDGAGSLITRQELDKCTYLHQVIQETLRLHPVAPGVLPRVVPQQGAVVGGGICLPAGTSVFVEAKMANYDPDIYKDPHSFNPERWDRHRVTPAMSQSFLTFSAGPRKCLGFELAWHELLFMTATLFLDFDVTRGDHTSMDEVVDFITLRPVDGTCPLQLTPRTGGHC